MSKERARAVENALTLYTKNRVSHLRNNKPEPNFDPFKRAVNAYIQELLNTNKRERNWPWHRWHAPRTPGAAANRRAKEEAERKRLANEEAAERKRRASNRWKSVVEKIPGSPPPVPPKPKSTQTNNNKKNMNTQTYNNKKHMNTQTNKNQKNKNTRSGFQKMINARMKNLKMVSNITGQKATEIGKGAWKATARGAQHIGGWFGQAGKNTQLAKNEFLRGLGLKSHERVKNNSRKIKRQNAMKKQKPSQSGMPSLFGKRGPNVPPSEYRRAVNEGRQGKPKGNSLVRNSGPLSEFRSPPSRGVSASSFIQPRGSPPSRGVSASSFIQPNKGKK